MQKKGFTLLELLIVIGILAILATAAVLVLNPAELLRQARDSTRASDLAAINSTLGLYLSTVASPMMDNRGVAIAGTSGCKNGGGATDRTYSAVTNMTYSSTTFSYASSAVSWTTSAAGASSSRAVDGSGWLPVNLNAISGGSSPLSNLPVDPDNALSSPSVSSTNLSYVYGCDNTANTYVIAARFESTKYNTDLDMDSKDGGTDISQYEVGNASGLNL